jgi:hypothetical protein
MNGFEVIEAVGGERMPLVIFRQPTTSKAFQRALDYLLKPLIVSASPKMPRRGIRSSG